MYVRDLKSLKPRFAVRYFIRHAEVECRRCHQIWSTVRLNGRDPRAFWLAGHRGRRPASMLELARHATRPH